MAAVVTLLLTLLGCAEQSATAPGTGTPDGSVWSAVGAGTYNSCALTADGSPRCWGFALLQACSAVECAVDTIPTRLTGPRRAFVSLDGGGGFHCGVTATAEAYCWGELLSGSLGDGVTQRSAAPVRVAIEAPVRLVTAGYDHACALTGAGVAYCWGGGGTKLGVGGSSVPRALPQRVATALTFTAISAGTTQTCAITPGAEAYCWGGGYGSLGVGARDTSCTSDPSCLRTATPLLVEGGLRWASISAGNAFTCGVTVDQRGYCWGAVQYREDPNPPLGVLGNGQFAGSRVPVPVSGGHMFRLIATGTRQACGLTNEGTAFCWGSNGMGELGTGQLGGRAATPQRVAGNHRFSALSLAENSCGLAVEGALYCWGSMVGGGLGNGRVGLGGQPVPVRVRASRD